MAKNRVNIYKSRFHLFFTLLVVAAPFSFLLLFSKIAKIATAKLFLDVFTSFWRLLLAYFISAILAWIFAVAFYRGKRSVVALPLFDVLQSFPAFASLPIAVIFWGRSNFTVVFFLVVTIIWPIFFSIISSLKLAKREWQEVARLYGLRRFKYFRHFLLPVSIPGLMTGTIIGLGEGWEALIATEIIINIKEGLGSFFTNFSGNPTITAFGILGVLILVFSINKLLWLPLLERSHRKMAE